MIPKHNYKIVAAECTKCGAHLRLSFLEGMFERYTWCNDCGSATLWQDIDTTQGSARLPDEDWVLQAYANGNGLPPRKIAKEVGISRQQVINILVRKKLVGKGHK